MTPFPTAMHISAVLVIEDRLIPAVDLLVSTFRRLEDENQGVVKSGRTHLQDATPIRFSQEISGWRASLEKDKKMLELALPELKELALGGTAVGTGSTPLPALTRGWPRVSELTGKTLSPRPTSSTPSPARTSWSLPTGR